MTSIPEIVSVDDLAGLLGVEPRTVRNYAARGVITKLARGKIELAPAIRAIVSEARKGAAEGPEERARARLAEEKARAAAIRNAREMRELITVTDARAVLDELCGVFRAELAGLPARVTRDIRLRDQLDREIERLLVRIADEIDLKAAAEVAP